MEVYGWLVAYTNSDPIYGVHHVLYQQHDSNYTLLHVIYPLRSNKVFMEQPSLHRDWQVMIEIYCQQHQRLLFSLIPAGISDKMSNKLWDEITYSFIIVNGGSVEIWGWMSNFISHIIMDAITNSCITNSILVKRPQESNIVKIEWPRRLKVLYVLWEALPGLVPSRIK